jgi:hypothetical protein
MIWTVAIVLGAVAVLLWVAFVGGGGMDRNPPPRQR